MTCQFDTAVRQIIVPARRTAAYLKAFSAWCAFCFVIAVVRNPVLIRKSMELLKEITEMLRDIIASGDEERFRRLQEVVRALNESRQSVESRALH